MTTARLGDQDRSGSAFLVERYVPPSGAENLAAAITRAARLGALRAASGSALGVQYLLSAYVPAEDTCFCLFLATTADAVRVLNHEAELPLDRISAAILLYPPSPLAHIAESRHP
jgi:Protein of unknown function (DUF4242)